MTDATSPCPPEVSPEVLSDSAAVLFGLEHQFSVLLPQLWGADLGGQGTASRGGQIGPSRAVNSTITFTVFGVDAFDQGEARTPVRRQPMTMRSRTYLSRIVSSRVPMPSASAVSKARLPALRA